MKHTLILLLLPVFVFGQKASKKDYLVTMQTNMGTMHLVLFDDTPLHKKNFLELVKSSSYDSVIFHRVIHEFMIQGGNLSFKKGKEAIYEDEKREKIPFEFTPKHVHLRGALAAARTNNPEKASSFSQFYIVTGKTYTNSQLKSMELRTKLTYTEEQFKSYMEIGGTPFLDNNYTVFGEVIQGMEVAEKIQKVETTRDKPNEDIWMVVKAKKMRKKKISKLYNYTYSHA